MRILLTNDDGIDAPGLVALWESINETFGDSLEITVIAPDRGRSECGHSVTTGRPLHVEQVRSGWFSVDGTPVDCVRAGLASLAPNVNLVLSGVNAGANLGVDLLVSGTFAAAREAAIQSVPAMAISHYRRPDVPATWDHVPQWLMSTLQEFAEMAVAKREGPIPHNTILWNVNLPAIHPQGQPPPRVRCAIDSRPLERVANRTASKITFESDFHNRPRGAGSDVERCFAGSITISEIAPHSW